MDEKGFIALPEDVVEAAPGTITLTDQLEAYDWDSLPALGFISAIDTRLNLTLMDHIDLFAFHQSNKHTLKHVGKKLDIPAEKFPILLENSGNTISSTIPIALTEASRTGILRPGMKVLLLGFGVGLSRGGAVITW